MVLVLSNQQLVAMRAHAERVYPEECCGLIVGTLDAAQVVPYKTVVELAALDNRWTSDVVDSDEAELEGELSNKAKHSEHIDKRRRYWIDPVDILRVQKRARGKGLGIIGVYHSHPDNEAVPSECDRAQAWPDYAYAIVSVQSGKAVDVQNWALDSAHQFQPEAMQIAPSSATDRMPISA
ncbi:M67 family metallopeptidase [cf. Phormidesmis sp. LEGE 11477]|uniref:M67 family metallopeptidase n=1 Tax=cf. Phormidesmis sp. LEGE 11477 TaxID=1828680 RepID=UPI001882F834|nr:M67 family metallopeptidase [cf. Phormidesmis sp. LEGE 11477]